MEQETDHSQATRSTFKLKCGVTIAALVFIGLHLVFPNLKIDAVTLGLLVVALVPWLAPIVKSVEIPGLKIELPDVQSAAKAVIDTSALLVASAAAGGKAQATLSSNAEADIGGTAKVTTKSEKAVADLRNVAESDPNLALVGFRIEIETRLRELAKQKNIEDNRSISLILRQLGAQQALPHQTISALNDLIALGNKAAHGQKVDPAIGPWILDRGGEVLAVLDKFLRV